MAVKKTNQQLANEQQTEEIKGAYAENIQREGTKQKLIESLTAKFTSTPQQGTSPTVVLLLVIIAMGGVAFFMNRQSQSVKTV